VNVNRNVPPWGSELEKKETGDPESEAIAWSAVSRLVQVTVLPAGTVSVVGLKVKFWIVMAPVPPATVDNGEGVTPGFEDEVQPAKTAAAAMVRINATTGNKRPCSGIVQGLQESLKYVCTVTPLTPSGPWKRWPRYAAIPGLVFQGSDPDVADPERGPVPQAG